MLSGGNDPGEKGLDCWRQVLRCDGAADGAGSRGGRWPQELGQLEKGQEHGIRGFLTGCVCGVWMAPSDDLLSQ